MSAESKWNTCCVQSCLRQWPSWNIRLQVMTSQELHVETNVMSHPCNC